MTSQANWTTPADIKGRIEKRWQQGRFLAARFAVEPLFPLPLPLRKPDARALSDRFADVREWIRMLEDGSKAKQGYGYDIEWSEINHRQLGRNRVPAGILVPSELDALRLIGKHHQAAQFRRLTDVTLQRFPMLDGWLARRSLLALDHAADWERVLAVLTWFSGHSNTGLYLRQLDIPGVDTKFIESHKGLLAELLDLMLPASAVHRQFTSARHFEPRYGLTSKPPLIRFRVLDDRLRINGFSDLSVPAAEFARLSLPLERVFITENDVNGLAFPATPHSLVIFGLGYDLDRLAETAWLEKTKLHYWGDIDTHGFAILDRLRASCPHAQSFLMDRETLMTHATLWVRESNRSTARLSRLTPSERALFDDLVHDRLGDHVRLEQERIRFGWVQQTLRLMMDS